MSGSSKQPHAKGKTLIIEDDCEAEALDEANPFSFKEFVKSQTFPGFVSSNSKRAFSKDSNQSTTQFRGPSECPDGNLEFQETYFRDPTLYDDLQEDEDDDWSGSYHPSVIENTHGPKVPSPAGTDGDESYGYGASDMSGDGLITGWQQAVLPSPPAGLHGKTQHRPDSTSDSEEGLRLLQINCEELQEENLHLKSKICKLKELNDSQNEKVRQLERKLEERILEEQKEAQDLESMVQQVEKNLQMMTKRAAKAEGNVTKLKQEMALLQIELTTYKAENEALRRGETAGMNAVKQNSNLALENLQKVVSGAQSSIKQLVAGAEALTLVAELLRSIDKIAEIHNDGVP
ncbi:hypothetical protein XENTR_v10020095 [Xenopus tropicalis]|uniref:Endosome-associated-trafficking regulator 1 n=1 Tax=Xenopus tropicalis TaxID=8364 RepID=ENTR1_XENTR|nr:endosome-associated-trafficking regulator 1 [Xenopus tropicalis]Q28GJ0.1 RecName: Full=Endosome-associated-trafficking regulator 1; AltName: Full=Serologically defined colon cancer antigen 3 homolog [Xenopus tropicalis]AAI58295.1 serologically defined colon cancer antigen 3 [Xenopus tropicalis]KAE8582367.1 hypothetical protein XENTR_v10020095 [Xenopus tropicalis]CAJ81711.1 serologically defined colon cancer antigen 3 [Xenopus tropicalis]|eukprot:NP_001037937.1 endosome-associated-trafficking regulator 1 [Xenopus tropicalis]